MISDNGYDCQEMYGEPCQPELAAVRMGVACYECKVCGCVTQSAWPSDSSPDGAKYDGSAS